jgi:hypothetical protein
MPTKDRFKDVSVALVCPSGIDACELRKTTLAEEPREERIRLSTTVQVEQSSVGGQRELLVQSGGHTEIEHAVADHFQLLEDLAVFPAELKCT